MVIMASSPVQAVFMSIRFQLVWHHPISYYHQVQHEELASSVTTGFTIAHCKPYFLFIHFLVWFGLFYPRFGGGWLRVGAH